ncbi:hypothetical protein SSP24_12770 [Streptomyces spinoverrucosus]|uniref:Winged helix DNA-binding domain-containing protein n=1 Tax=Streptomyces spinoverrucosus TaxID=284043 RepID=A0A4Y3V8U3_9ACTN|nr:hypothetical protein SSP24_12770 [Streptomyces spinoverrucosus]GHB51256.1 hypothetical protein GCM10010397_21900 [Streptomyces spinoverrucosus]
MHVSFALRINYSSAQTSSSHSCRWRSALGALDGLGEEPPASPARPHVQAEQRHSGEARATYVTLTQKGRAALTEAAPRHSDHVATTPAAEPSWPGWSSRCYSGCCPHRTLSSRETGSLKGSP